jgi:Tfp pilus assembly protein PilN
MSTLLTTRQQTLPHVNLLPPEIAEGRRFRRLQVGLGAVVVVAAGVVVALYSAAAAQVGEAEAELAESRAQNATLQAKAAEYAHVPQTYAEVDAAQTQLEQAMGREVRWSYYLNDLSLTIPEHVWLTSMTVTSVDPAPLDPAAGAAPAAAVAGPVAQVAFAGKAYAHDDVATWLDTVAEQYGYEDPYFSVSQLTLDEDLRYVEFDSSVTVNADALSGRWLKKNQEDVR